MTLSEAVGHCRTLRMLDLHKVRTITVNVTNINDNDPSIADATVQVLETINAGTEIIDLKDSVSTQDTDRDGDAISYSITSGNDEGLFAIATSTGKINLATGKSLDFDTRDQHVLQVQGTDGSRKDTASITIDVTDSNTAPTALDDNYTLNENATVSKNVSNGVIQSLLSILITHLAALAPQPANRRSGIFLNHLLFFYNRFFNHHGIKLTQRQAFKQRVSQEVVIGRHSPAWTINIARR